MSNNSPDLQALIDQADKARNAKTTTQNSTPPAPQLAPGQYTQQVINPFGLDKTIPKGFVTVVTNRDGTLGGYLVNGKVHPPITPADSEPQSQLGPATLAQEGKTAAFQYAQHLQGTAEKQLADFNSKLEDFKNPNPRARTQGITKDDLEKALSAYESTIKSIHDAYQKSGYIEGSVSVDQTGKLTSGSTYFDPKTQVHTTVTPQGAVPTASVPTTSTSLSAGRVGNAGITPPANALGQGATGSLGGLGNGSSGGSGNGGINNPPTKKIPPVSDAAIIADMKVNAPWNYAIYTSDNATPEQKAKLLQWGHEAQQGLPPTKEQIAAETYHWPQTQLWTQAQNQHYEDSFKFPGEYKSQLAAAQNAIQDIIKSNGLNPDQATIDKAVNQSFIQGWGANDSRILSTLANGSTFDTAHPTAQVAKDLDAFKQIANDYGVPLPKDPVQLNNFIKGAIGVGGSTAEFTNYAKQIAKAQYPWLSQSIDQGILPSAYLQPYATTIANTLDTSPTAINWQDPKWSSLLQKTDPTGNKVPATYSDVIAKVKTDPTYGYGNTLTAKNEATDFATQLRTMFGFGQ